MRHVTEIGSDDRYWHHADAFGGWIRVKAARNTPDVLLAALKSGAFYASQGPVVQNEALDDGMVEVRCSPVSAVILAGPRGRRQREPGQTPTRVRLTQDPDQGGSRRLTLRDAFGRRAWTNPLWLGG